MIESEVIVYSFLAAGFLSLIGFAAFIWMNMADRSKDEKIYKQKTDPRDLVSKYKHTGKALENDPNPITSLKKYVVKDSDADEDTLKILKKSETVKKNNTETKNQTEQPADNSRFAPPNSKSRDSQSSEAKKNGDSED